METINVYTQESLDEALKRGIPVNIKIGGKGSFSLCTTSIHTVSAYDFSTVFIYNCCVLNAYNFCTIYAADYNTVHAFDFCKVHAYHHSIIHAQHSSTIFAKNSSIVRASPCVHVQRWSRTSTVTGGIVTDSFDIVKNAIDWCAYYGIPIVDGIVTLYKATREDYTTRNFEFPYVPGTTPVAPDWDGGKKECGGGLHFSPFPRATLQFDDNPKHFIACPVLLSEIVVHWEGEYPDKVKAPRCCAPVWECDIDGN